MISIMMVKPEGMVMLDLAKEDPTFLTEEEENPNHTFLNRLLRNALTSIIDPEFQPNPHQIAAGIVGISDESYNIMYGNLEVDASIAAHLQQRLTSDRVCVLAFDLPDEIDHKELAGWKGKIKSKHHDGQPTGLRKKILSRVGTQEGRFDVNADKTLNFLHTADTEEEAASLLTQIISEGQVMRCEREDRLKDILEGRAIGNQEGRKYV